MKEYQTITTNDFKNYLRLSKSRDIQTADRLGSKDLWVKRKLIFRNLKKLSFCRRLLVDGVKKVIPQTISCCFIFSV